MAAAWTPPETYVEGWHDLESVKKMPYRQFGDRKVSLLTYGGSSLAGMYGAVSKEEVFKVVETAIKSGINVIDTAPWYGHGKSEEILGEILANIPRKAYYLHTKCARYNPGPLDMFDFSYDRIIRSVDESLKRLRVDYIDTLQVHDPEFAPSLDVVLQQTLPAMEECRKSGKVKYIGITGYPLATLRYLAEHSPVPIHTCITYSRYNLHDRGLVDDGTLAFLQGKGIAVLNASPLSMGLLTHRGPPAWHPAKAETKARCAAAAAYCAERGVDISRLALLFCMESPVIATTLTSTASLQRLKHDVEMAQGAHPLTDTERAVMGEVIETFFSGPAYAGLEHWEGQETNAYWANVGKALLARYYEQKAAVRAAGGDVAAVQL